MKLFGIDFGSPKPAPPRITPPDREWVEAGFRWLLKVYSYPRGDQHLLTAKSFPLTFSSSELKVESLIADCCTQLGLDKQHFSYEVYEDLRDTQNIPYAIIGQPIDCLLHADELTGNYTIDLAKSIFKTPNYLIAAVCYELVKARLMHSKIAFDNGPEHQPFLYLAAVYFGYGAMLAQHLAKVGSSSDGLWETKWAYRPAMPYPMMAYALAVFAKLKNDPQPGWREALPGELRQELDRATTYLRTVDDGELFDQKRIEDEFTAHALYKQAFQQYRGGEVGEAVSLLQQALSLTNDASLQAHVLHNLGYYRTRLGDYPGGIAALRSCLALQPDYLYGNDNLGFALVMSGELEEGKRHLDQALHSKRNNEAYTFRNLALYHQQKQEFAQAEAYFKQAFDANTPVDLLDFLYGQYLLETGHREQGMEHIRTAARLGEHEAVARLRELEGLPE